MKYHPRNDMVLIKIVDLGQTPSGIKVAAISAQGKKFFVEAIGPNVEGLKAGDEVLMLGSRNVSYFELPNEKDLIVMKQEHVVLVIKDET